LANTNSFQIVGGEHRGRRFSFPDAPGLRPTSNKIRETLFNWIQFESVGKTYLDLFCGSGALSFEALSRGAKQIISIEKNQNAFRSLEKNQKILKSDKIYFFNQDAFDYLTQNSEKVFDFIFLDPPFNQNLLPKALKLLSKGDFINSKSKIYIESEFEISQAFLNENFSQKIKINKQKRSSNVNYCLVEVL